MRSSLVELTAESGASGRKSIIAATEQANAFQRSLASSHPNQVNVWNTSDRKRAELLADYLNSLEAVCPNPRLIPLDDAGKSPAIEGTCTLGSRPEEQMPHTRE